eukprot:UN00569
MQQGHILAPHPLYNETLSFQLSANYSFEPTPNNLYVDWSAAAAAGGLQMAPLDLIAFYKGVFIDKKIISIDSIKKMQNYKKIAEAEYGFGLMRQEYPTAFGHGGTIDGFFSQIAVYPMDPSKDDPVSDDDEKNDHFSIAYSCNALATTYAATYNAMLKSAYQMDILPLPDLDVLDNQNVYYNYSGVYHFPGIDNYNFTIKLVKHKQDVVPNKNITLTWYQTENGGATRSDPSPLVFYEEKDLYINAQYNFAIRFGISQADIPGGKNYTVISLIQPTGETLMYKWPGTEESPNDNDGGDGHHKIPPPSHIGIFIVAFVVLIAIVAIIVYYYKQEQKQQQNKVRITTTNYYWIHQMFMKL